MKRIHSDGDPRCVAVIEPVQRAVGSFLFNAEVKPLFVLVFVYKMRCFVYKMRSMFVYRNRIFTQR